MARLPDGKKGQAFNSTLGAATDLVAAGSRRLFVNAAYHLLGVQVPTKGTNVEIVGKYEPSNFSFGIGKKYRARGIKPQDHAIKKLKIKN